LKYFGQPGLFVFWADLYEESVPVNSAETSFKPAELSQVLSTRFGTLSGPGGRRFTLLSRLYSSSKALPLCGSNHGWHNCEVNCAITQRASQ
jgi:hypothetical protein